MENIISVNLSTTTAPVVTETRGKDWIDYGTEEWANLYPQFLIDLYYNSSTQAAIINATAELIAGEDLVIEDEEDRELESIVKLKKFFSSANSNETLNEVIKKVAFDFKLQGAFALNIVWSQDRTQIAEIYHIGVDKIRAEKPNELGKVEAYYVSTDWSNTRENEPYRVPAFNTNDRTSPNQILYTGIYSPNMNAYYTPDYVAGNNWALVDQRVAEFHLNNISNGFSASFMINFANGVPTLEERLQIENSLAAKFSGADNSGKMIITFSDDKTRTPEITAITPSDLDKQYVALQELLVQNILTAHRVTSPILMGIKSDTGLGNNADELNSAANFYLNTVVAPFQSHIIKTLRKIFTVNGMDMPVRFEQLKPITTRFTNQDLAAVMTQDEIREELGLAPLAREEVVVDAGLTKMSEFTELESCINKYGEDMPEGWKVFSEELAEEELEEFNFEAELHAKYFKFASTGSPNVNAESGQDQKSKQSDYVDDIYRVRYRYAGSPIGEREFCKKMVSANKLYRKEDIIQMGTKPVNAGWGEGGSNTYSIWKWKGGALCEHRWYRVIMVQEGKSPSNSDKIITSTEAKSRGVSLPRNAQEVSVAPHDMPNHGFVNPYLINKYKNV
tara:strand:+ start:1378 stop:3234 length:1857 start_codon:yes stop_codon:yes gene_type:complete